MVIQGKNEKKRDVIINAIQLQFKIWPIEIKLSHYHLRIITVSISLPTATRADNRSFAMNTDMVLLFADYAGPKAAYTGTYIQDTTQIHKKEYKTS